MASRPCCCTGYQPVLVLPSGQVTWRVFQSIRNAALSKPSASRAWREWSPRSGVIMVMPSRAASVTRSAEG